jgi:hypothetical protein
MHLKFVMKTEPEWKIEFVGFRKPGEIGSEFPRWRSLTALVARWVLDAVRRPDEGISISERV